MKLLSILLTILLCLSAIIGDYVVFRSKYSESQVFRAFSDSSVHAIIGLISGMLFFTYDIGLTTQARIYNVIFCTILSSLIDIDHFIAARSFKLKDATNLKQRGIFHCTTFWLLITILLIIYTYITKKLNIYIITYMTIIAYTSHHIRDGNRRGLWLYPIGETSPINKHVYVLLICILPRLYAYLYVYFKRQQLLLSIAKKTY
ncbi:PREDICTED: transmembrane protein C5orf28 homolog [Papilio xuthus]|uniref:Transmembrane protein 267 n=1 Tax=Papilio xuthus TaxID=66420 RepID=A0AAJ6Z0A6_PAPXU|nr:PREDICTED: transmembrane protein C5orf28 homolog [Papilio xuthus]